MRRQVILILALVGAILAVPAVAQAHPALEPRIAALESAVAALDGRVDALEAAPGVPAKTLYDRREVVSPTTDVDQNPTTGSSNVCPVSGGKQSKVVSGGFLVQPYEASPDMHIWRNEPAANGEQWSVGWHYTGSRTDVTIVVTAVCAFETT